MNTVEQVLNAYPCDKDCRFSELNTMSTLMYYAPVYDKHGNNLNPDKNTRFSTLRCGVCDKTFDITSKYGEEPLITMR